MRRGFPPGWWVDRFIQKLANIHHVHHGGRLIGLRQNNQVEVIDAIAHSVVDEKVLDGVLIRESRTHLPKGIGLRHVLHQGFIVGEAQAGSRRSESYHRGRHG
jgi:hypothetical protein